MRSLRALYGLLGVVCQASGMLIQLMLLIDGRGAAVDAATIARAMLGGVFAITGLFFIKIAMEVE